ncbi:amidohydrolase [Adhaeribacter radiodurans]|uniref:Omega-amidase YafV n=1 Tax=Adhaeribacter radiodurans TaxID=2745197 RepID=A0A7L7LD24_9BACT|nr:amidohydrolase [Adhaeribacter radiodurans]QMU30594.1 amidohydrolase [Adhaeribacter radiodurans]
MQNLTITFIQTPLYWHDRALNLEMLAHKIEEINQPTDLIILPEMFTTGFSMQAPELAETMYGPTLLWLQNMAAATKAVITGSLIIKEGENYFNRLIWMPPDGNYAYYDKKHLFRMAGETQVYAAGARKLIVTLKGWKVCPLICYDLRFPVWSRNVQNEYDLLLYVANWPAKRDIAWKTLLPARAIENVAYVAGVNRIGDDGNGHLYNGDSMVVNFKGAILFSAGSKESTQTITLNRQELEDFRKSFPAYLDADDFTIS